MLKMENLTTEKGQRCIAHWLCGKNNTEEAEKKHIMQFTRGAGNLGDKSKMSE